MANDTDFIALYQDLGIQSGCALEEFRTAYRRRVAQLHPDRQPLPEDRTDQLQQLNAMYAAAMQFYLQHGRLPGAAGSTVRRPVFHAQRGEPSLPDVPRVHRHYLRWSLALIACTAAVVFWNVHDDQGQSPAGSGTNEEAVDQPRGSRMLLASRIELGMTAAQVLAIQGEPVARNATLWEFGPSWITFECGTVSDWYSSRMRPLKVGTSEPSSVDKDSMARARKPCRMR